MSIRTGKLAMSKWGPVLAITLACMSSVASMAGPRQDDSAKNGMPATVRLSGNEVEALFTDGFNEDARATARKHAIKLAMAGDGHSAFYLGVLFRHGADHPAQAVDRDLDTARYWLEKCVASAQCPQMALASLAELEIRAKHYEAAMQWAQAAALFERELDKSRGRQNPPGDAAYWAYLLQRCFEYLPKRDRDNAVAQSFAAFVSRRGAQLERMLAYARDGQEQAEQNWVDFSARESRIAVTNREPKAPVMALYLVRAAPQGGRPETAVLVEAVPTPRDAWGLDGVARGFDSKPYQPAAPGQRRYGFIPIRFADPRYEMAPARD